MSVSDAGAELIEAERRASQEWLQQRLAELDREQRETLLRGRRPDVGHRRRKRLSQGRWEDATDVVDVDDPADPRLDDFRDLNSIDRRPDLPSGKGLVIAEGVLVVQRMLASRFGRARCWAPTVGCANSPPTSTASMRPYYRASAEVMADVVGFHLNRGVLAAAPRPAELTVAEVLDGARTVAVLEGVNDHENLGSIFRNAAGLGVDAVVFGTGCADPLYRRAVRVSMGHALLVPYAWAAAVAG